MSKTLQWDFNVNIKHYTVDCVVAINFSTKYNTYNTQAKFLATYTKYHTNGHTVLLHLEAWIESKIKEWRVNKLSHKKY